MQWRESLSQKLFDKAVVFTDIHWGMRNNSREHNINCENFVKWMIAEAQAFGAEVCIFLGDWHHNRSSVNVSTLNYSVSAFELLDKSFNQYYHIVGNHDAYYREKLEIHSSPFARSMKKIKLIDSIFTTGNVSFVPWLVGDEWKKVTKLKSSYIFGHFELPKFKMNAMVEMPDTGQLNYEHFKNQKQVFSGHFHKRQNKANVQYIGNAFPHNFADSWDDERGIMLLEWGNDPIFKNWPDSPKYRTLKLSQLLIDPTQYVDKNTYAKISIDVELNYEEINYIKETLLGDLGAKEINFLTNNNNQNIIDTNNLDINFESVDSIVLSHLKSIESSSIESQLLIDIYNSI